MPFVVDRKVYLTGEPRMDYVTAMQNDSASRYIRLTVYGEDEQVFVISQLSTLVLRAKKDDGTFLFNGCTLTDDGKIMVPLTSQTLAVIGMLTCVVQIILDGATLTTVPFLVKVIETPVSQEEIESLDEFTAFELVMASSAKVPGVYETEEDLPSNPDDGLSAIVANYARGYTIPTTGVIYPKLYINIDIDEAPSSNTYCEFNDEHSDTDGRVSYVILENGMEAGINAPCLILMRNPDEVEELYVKVFENLEYEELGLELITGWNKVTISEDAIVPVPVQLSEVPQVFNECIFSFVSGSVPILSSTPFVWNSDIRYSYGGEWLRYNKSAEIKKIPYIAIDTFGPDSVSRLISMSSNELIRQISATGIFDEPTWADICLIKTSSVSDSSVKSYSIMYQSTDMTDMEQVGGILEENLTLLFNEAGLMNYTLSITNLSVDLGQNGAYSWTGKLVFTNTSNPLDIFTEQWKRSNIPIQLVSDEGGH